MPTNPALIERLRELARDHMGTEGRVQGWTSIAETLNSEGLLNTEGNPWDRNSIRNYYRRMKKAGLVEQAINVEKAIISMASDKSETSDKTVDVSDRPDISDGTQLPEEWRRQISQMIQTELKTMMASLQTVQEDQTAQAEPARMGELAPTPSERIKGQHGKPINPGGRVKIAGTVDERLEALFQQWRESKGISLSRALDAALWHFLGKPKLSFEMLDQSKLSDDEAE
jgi:hypothetical protein